jgi:hypothetical protein
MRMRATSALLAAVALVFVGLTAVPSSAAYTPTARDAWTANGTVYAIATSGDRVYIGGRFTRVTNSTTGQVVARDRLAAFDRSTGALIASFSPSADADVRALAVSPDGSTVYAGGTFTAVNGESHARVVALDTAGDTVSGWDVAADKEVRDIVSVGGDLFLAGLFGKVNGVTMPGLAKVTAATGQVERSWKVPATGGKPRSIYPLGSDLLIGGSFTTLEGQPRTFLGSATMDTGDVTSWAPAPGCDNCVIFDVVASGDSVYTAAGGSGGRATQWSYATGAAQWYVRGDGNVQAVGLADGILYAGGHFGPTFGGQTRHQLAAIDVTTGKVRPWDAQLGGKDFPGIWVIDAGSDYLRIGGGFTIVGGVSRPRYAEFPFA